MKSTPIHRTARKSIVLENATSPKKGKEASIKQKRRSGVAPKVEEDSLIDASEIRATLPNISSLRALVSQEISGYHSVFLQAESSFKSNLPYIVAYNPWPVKSFVFDVASVVKEHRPSDDGTLQSAEILHELWGQVFPSSRFLSFIDDESAPVDLGTVKDLERMGIEGFPLLSRLLDPKMFGEESRIMHSILIEECMFKEAPSEYAVKLENGLSDEMIEKTSGEMLIDTCSSRSTQLLLMLLRRKVDPNFYSPWMEESALSQALAAGRSDNVRLLKEAGAKET